MSVNILAPRDGVLWQAAAACVDKSTDSWSTRRDSLRLDVLRQCGSWSMPIDVSKIEELAPDQASLGAAAKLKKADLWPLLAGEQTLVWGECHGSGSSPYRVICSDADFGFKCTCPSRKLPCKAARRFSGPHGGGAAPRRHRRLGKRAGYLPRPCQLSPTRSGGKACLPSDRLSPEW
jgi:hypothetical protein